MEDRIAEFFKTATSVPRKQCDDWVLACYGQQGVPVAYQGLSSYTVALESPEALIIQFREELSPFPDSLMNVVRAAAAKFVPEAKYHGTVGTDKPLHIYEMKKIPGYEYLYIADATKSLSSEAKKRQKQTIDDMARYVAS